VHERSAEHVAVFAAFLGRARGVRRLGSAALDLCYIAAGRLEGFWEEYLHPWDMAAGMLIVTEAGGRVTDYAGVESTRPGGEVLATNGLLHAAMLDAIAHARELPR
jgi:myo-inositol-1(or 4)-monophosphatase